MSEPEMTTESRAELSREDMHSALFANLVVQQSNMAMMFLGKVAHPQTGKSVRDIDAARMFIDQLEMLEAKTKGNLSKEESTLLKQSLMSLRLAFVESVESSPSQAESRPEPAPSPQAKASTEATKGTIEPAPSVGEEEEHRKKFTKKY
jgi:hypothetical protein